ncbi:MAG TPA: hypothetical protein VEK07_19400 [Polyangiaceae bacterium]|nr:hypothetical protein [Polyangiaceae bacterium]
MCSLDPEKAAGDELCRILRSCVHGPLSETVHSLKRELHLALRRAFYAQDRAQQLNSLLALHDSPRPTDCEALRAMRRAVRVMRERCAPLEATCDDLLCTSQPEQTQPVLLPAATGARRPGHIHQHRRRRPGNWVAGPEKGLGSGVGSEAAE